MINDDDDDFDLYCIVVYVTVETSYNSCCHRFEANRLRTFDIGWPDDCPVRPNDLAATGMYYVGVRDVVRCAFCGGSLKQWDAGDDPIDEHRKFFPACPFLLGENVGNVPLPTQLSRTQSFPLEFRQASSVL